MSCSTRPLAPSHPSRCRIRHGMWDGTGTQPTTRWVFPLNPRSPGSPRGARPLLLVGFVLLAAAASAPLLQPGLAHPALLSRDSVLPNLVGRARLYTVGQDSVVLVRKAQECGCPVQPPLHLEVSVAPGHRRGSSRGG